MIPRVAFVFHVSDIQGNEGNFIKILSLLNAFDVKIFCLGHDGKFNPQGQVEGVEIEYVDTLDNSWRSSSIFGTLSHSLKRGYLLLKNGRRLSSSLEFFKPNVVYSYSDKAHTTAAVAARRSKVPLIVHLQDPLGASSQSVLSRVSSVLLFLNAHQVITNSQPSKKIFERFLWRTSPIVMDKALPRTRERATARDFVGRDIIFGVTFCDADFERRERTLEMFEKVRELDLYKNAKLLILDSLPLGSSESGKEFLDQIRQSKLSQHITFLNENVYSNTLFDEIDIWVQVRNPNGVFDYLTFRAQSRGCVVVTDNEDITNNFTYAGLNGLAYSAGPIFVDSIVEVFSESTIQQLVNCSMNAIKTHQGSFSEEAITAHLSEILNLVVSGPSNSLTGAKTAVAHLNHSNLRGGAEFALARTLLLDTNWETKAFVDLKGGVFVDALQSLGRQRLIDTSWSYSTVKEHGKVKIVKAAQSITSLIAVGIRLRSDRQFRSCQVIHANTTKALFAASISKRRGQKLLFHLRDDLSDSNGGYLGRSVVKALFYLRADAVVANSGYTLQKLGKTRKHVIREVIPSPIGSSDYTIAHEKFLSSRTDSKIVFCCVARLSPWKGQMLLLDAFAPIAFEKPNTELWLAGSADYETSDFESLLRQKARQLGIESQVKFLGHISNVPDLLSKVDICVQCSVKPEPLGQNVLQYLAAGKATIVTDEGGPSEWVINEVNGLKVRPRDVDDLSEKMMELVQKPNLRFRLESETRKLFPKNFDQSTADNFGRLVGRLNKLEVTRD